MLYLTQDGLFSTSELTKLDLPLWATPSAFSTVVLPPIFRSSIEAGGARHDVDYIKFS